MIFSCTIQFIIERSVNRIDNGISVRDWLAINAPALQLGIDLRCLWTATLDETSTQYVDIIDGKLSYLSLIFYYVMLTNIIHAQVSLFVCYTFIPKILNRIS